MRRAPDLTHRERATAHARPCFVALGGAGAYAAGQIGSSDITKNAVKAKHIKDGQGRNGR